MTARKRFYKDVTVTEDLGIALDGRPVKTPMKAPLVLPTRALADAVAAEWAEQGEEIKPATMYLTKLANTAIDRVGVETVINCDGGNANHHDWRHELRHCHGPRRRRLGRRSELGQPSASRADQGRGPHDFQ